jgi:hypothetical protein
MEITDELVNKITDELWRRLAPEASAADGGDDPALAGLSDSAGAGQERAGNGAGGRAPGPGRRVLTEADLRAACPVAGGPGQTFRLSPGDILTPLAQDYVQSMKIDLSRG